MRVFRRLGIVCTCIISFFITFFNSYVLFGCILIWFKCWVSGWEYMDGISKWKMGLSLQGLLTQDFYISVAHDNHHNHVGGLQRRPLIVRGDWNQKWCSGCIVRWLYLSLWTPCTLRWWYLLSPTPRWFGVIKSIIR